MVTSRPELPDDDFGDWPVDERILRYQLTYTAAVVVRIADHPHLIAWATEQGRYVDVTDRPWANPYPFGPDGYRRDSLDQYTNHLWSTAEMTDQLPSLAGKVLGCDCTLKGAVCHADILVRAVDDRATCCRCGRVGDGRHWRQDLDDGLNYLGQCCDVCEREAMWPRMRALVEGLDPLRGYTPPMTDQHGTETTRVEESPDNLDINPSEAHDGRYARRIIAAAKALNAATTESIEAVTVARISDVPGAAIGSGRYLNVAQVEERLGLGRGALSRAKMPPADAIVGPVNGDGSLPRGTARGWLPETIGKWAPTRPGRGARTDLHE